MKYSHQRVLIKEILKNRSDHPTADMVYDTAREREPQISLGTVYRNLKTLAESGEIDTLETVDKKLHYDGNVNKHGMRGYLRRVGKAVRSRRVIVKRLYRSGSEMRVLRNL